MQKNTGKEHGRGAKKTSGRVHQNSRIHRTPDILEMYGFSRATLYRMIKAGTFPPPLSLTGIRAVGWLDASLREWERRLAEAGDGSL